MFVCSVSLEQCKDRAFTESKCLSVTAQSIHAQTVSAIHRLPGLDAGYSLKQEKPAREAEKKERR